tara:strand:+ start:185 stop:1405 length:1221 start_codon:yes stop_codon:yes gene_type:complete
MASTFTTNIRLEKQGDGENPNSWGTILNSNVIDLVDQAVAAYQIVSVSGTTPLTLTQVNGATDQSRKAILSFDGTLTAETSIIIPSVNKMYYVRNNTSGSHALKVKTAGNTAITIEQGSNVMVATDGTNVFQTAFPTSVSSFTANSLTATSVSTSVLNATKISTSIMTATQVSATAIHATSVSAVSGRFSGTVSASAFDGLGNQLSFGSDAQGDVYYYSGSSIARLPAGTSGQFLQTKGSSANPVWASGLVAQVTAVNFSSVTSVGANGAIPEDGTVPQISEGNRVSALDITITPQSASNILLIEANLVAEVAADNINRGILIFDASLSSAIGGNLAFEAGSGSLSRLIAQAKVTAGTTSQKSFRVHIGSSNNASCFVNGNQGGSSTPVYGLTIPMSSVKITEYTP